MNLSNNAERIARALIERFGDLAASVTRELAAVSDWSVCFMLCAPFRRPLVLAWPLTDCSKRCYMQCLRDDADDELSEEKTFKHFQSDADHISCKLVEIVNQHQHDPHSAETWREIADAIERLSVKPGHLDDER
jgi:hypothetical protein